ncbi:MAG TPA: nitroreductase family deazaflavin-dependent oxidoreductase [Candidatus Acidoferrales bacterium]|nr:nitroreductase family deazaflavin-dependent oxidoreductase [Candidatus Acidoferrales bacterium]
MNQGQRHFIRPGFVARAANRFYGWLAGVGLGPSYSYLLQVTGRKTGRTYSTPVNVLRRGKKLFLVATRGDTEWSRNALVDGNVVLKKGRVRLHFTARAVPDIEKPEILKDYLKHFNWMVRRFFPLSANAAASAFAEISDRYPVFELVR